MNGTDCVAPSSGKNVRTDVLLRSNGTAHCALK